MVERQEVGKIVHFYPNINVAIVDLTSALKVGDAVAIEGHGQSITQKVASMQIEHKAVQVGKKGQSVGLKVDQPVKEGDLVFKAAA